jgi:2-methylcitrate dehydratase PrpD
MVTIPTPVRARCISITEGLARFAATTRYGDLPIDVRTRAKASFLDTLGIAIGGVLEPAPRILGAHIRDLGTTGIATVIGQDFRCDAADAALVNGVAADIVGWSDISVTQMTHPSASIVPAACAVGEQTGASGSDVLAAHIIGTEVANKIGAGVKPGLQLRGWHPLAVLNTFGAAVAAGRLLELDTIGMQNALGIAGGEAAGMRVAMGTMSKALGAGRSARDGVRAASLAAIGFTGPADVIEARDGFLQTFGDGASGEGILEHLGDPYEFEHPGITLKKFPACTRSHNGIQALLDLRAEHGFTADDIEHIKCLVTPAVVDYLKYPRPSSAFEAKYSMQYCLAAALLDGRLTVGSFSDARTGDPAIRALISKIEMEVWDEYAKHGYNPPHAPYGCRLLIRLRDGSTLARQADRGPWEPVSPPSWNDIVDKFKGNAEATTAEPHISRIVSMVETLEELPDIRALMALL